MRGNLLLLFLTLLAFVRTLAGAEPAPITTCAAVRALPRDVAARGLPVEVRGVATFVFLGERNSFILQDETAGIFIAWADEAAAGLPTAPLIGAERVRPGMVVEVQGATGPGAFAPVIAPRTIRVVGTAPLPTAKPVPCSILRNGTYDCQRVELQGVVQYATDDPAVVSKGGLRLEVAAPDGHFVVRVDWHGKLKPEQCIDAEARFRGVAFTFFNQRGESLGASVSIGTGDEVEITQPPPPDPFAVPETSARALRPFSPEPPTLHRQKLRGTVTLSRPGSFFYLQEAGRAIRVHTRSPEQLQPGERVEVSGFPELTLHFAEMREGVFRRLGSEPPPAPVFLRSEQALAVPSNNALLQPAEQCDGQLVTVQGTVVNTFAGPQSDPQLLLEVSGRLVPAVLGRDVSVERLAALLPGAEVRATGVCLLQLASAWPAQDRPNATGFSVLLRDLDDVRLLRAPTWWTPRRLWTALSAALSVLAAALGWVWLLGRRVASRSAELAAEMQARTETEIEFRAALRERTRLAADLHDTLEQALSGLGFQLDAIGMYFAKAPDRALRHLGLARQLLSSSREDVRRSVYNLRAQGLANGSLTGALRAAGERATQGRAIRFSVEQDGESVNLSEFVAGNLLLLAQEAITNAVKHADASVIAARVAFRAEDVTVEVSDDGAGFDPAHSPGVTEGHFGLQGMRERVDRMNGSIEIASAPGRRDADPRAGADGAAGGVSCCGAVSLHGRSGRDGNHGRNRKDERGVLRNRQRPANPAF